MEATLAQLTAILGGVLEGPGERIVSGIKGIEEAGPSDVAFLANPKYAKALPICRAGVVLVKPEQKVPEGLAVIRVDDPHLAYAKLLTHATAKPYAALGVHSRAVVEEGASLGQEVSIHALAYVGAGARIGDRVVLHPGVYVGPGVAVGDDSVLHSNVVVYHGCLIGKRCIIHAGTVIGSDGYGFVPDGERHYKIPQVGIVQIDDDVELGANNTIDRAATGRTWIQSGVKTDNMVHVAHQCVVGEHSLLVAQVGVSGSTKLGRRVVLGGQVGLAGHITLGDGVMVAAQSGIAHSIEAGQVVSGTPAMPHRLWLRVSQLTRRLPELFDRVKALENAGRGQGDPHSNKGAPMGEVLMNLERILEILPHRFPFLLVDLILEIEPGQRVKALKNVTYNEHFFQGHFPRRPVMPGVLIIEAMAQAGGIMAYTVFPEAKGRLIYFMSIDKVKFRRPVVPGDQLILELTNLHFSSRAFKMKGQAFVEGKLVAEAELTAAIEHGNADKAPENP